jgi:hypothetical protein
MRPSSISAILDREFAGALAVHTPVMLWGPPGAGKSQIVAQVARRHGAALIDLRLSQMEPTDLRGIPFRNGERVEWSVPSLLPDATRHGVRGILFLDEITAAPPAVTAAAYQLILDRRLGEYRAPDGWAIFAAGNRYGDRGISYVMPSPLANRFTHYEIEPDLDDWVTWAHAAAIDPRVIAFLRFRPDLLFDFDATANPVAFPSPRSWEYAHRALVKFADAPQLLPEALCACVGSTAGIDQQYGVAAALVRRAVQASPTPQASRVFGNILRYAQNFPQREMGVMLVSDMQRSIGRPLLEVPEFAEWAASIDDLLLYDLKLERP